MIGNEAIARGALEAGVQLLSGYPGTPASEILDSVAKVANNLNIYAEWSTNEKVAFEVAFGGAVAGLRTMAVMKHVGLNVAADALMVGALSGVKGGMLLVVADDPGAFASQNEQDSRAYLMNAHLPCFEPASPQEAKDMVVKAFDISEELGQIIMIRTTTAVNHMFEDVTLGNVPTRVREGTFPHNEWPRFYVESHSMVCPRHEWAHEVIDGFWTKYDEGMFNRLWMSGGEKLGVIASGAAWNLAKEALLTLNSQEQIALLKIGVSNPPPKTLIESLLGAVSEILVLEDGEPFIENQVRLINENLKGKAVVKGRQTGNVPRTDRLDLNSVGIALSKLIGKQYPVLRSDRRALLDDVARRIPSRGISLCPGCPHHASLYALRRALRRSTSKRKLEDPGFVNLADIGCYGMAGYPPLEFQETTFSMGGGVGLANGIAHSQLHSEIIVASIGDSTFYHSGIPPLVNAVWNGAKFLLVIHHNSITAMTGGQPCPTTGFTAMNTTAPIIDIERVVRACGVEFVESVDPYDLNDTEDAYRRALAHDGVSVVICKRECVLDAARKGTKRAKVYVNAEKCDESCKKFCITYYACPGLAWDQETRKTVIDQTLCNGCGVCAQLCPRGAIVAELEA